MTKTEPVAHDPSKPSSFASRRAECEAYEAVHGVKPRAAPHALRAGHDEPQPTLVITSVRA